MTDTERNTKATCKTCPYAGHNTFRCERYPPKSEILRDAEGYDIVFYAQPSIKYTHVCAEHPNFLEGEII
jgi:hypothetical protein